MSDKKMSDKILKNKPAPFNYARCYNEQCPRATGCLRHVATLHTTNKDTFISIVNPSCIPADTTACPYFETAEKIHVAWGVSHLLDDIPYKDIASIKSQLVGYFGKTLYYRFYREERYLTPEDQAYVRQVFRRKGITKEPRYNSYSDEYNW